MVEDPPVLATIAAGAVIVLAVVLPTIAGTIRGRVVVGTGQRGTVLGSSSLVFLLGCGSWLVVLAVATIWAAAEIDARLAIIATPMIGLAAVIAGTIARAAGVGNRTVHAFAFALSFVVFAPLAVAEFSTESVILGDLLRPLDHAGALAALAAPGAAGAVALRMSRRPSTPADPLPTSRPLFVVGVTAIAWPAWIVWLMGMELEIDDLTSRIVVNATVGPLTCLAVWLVVERVRTSHTTATTSASGIICGLAAISPGSAFMDPVGSIVIGSIAGVVCSTLAVTTSLGGRPGEWLLALTVPIASTTGVVLLGLFATRTGLAYIGQPELLIAQAAAAAAVVAYAGVIAFLVLAAARAFGRRSARRRQGGGGPTAVQ